MFSQENKIKNILIGLLVSIFFLAIVEGIFRIGGTVYYDNYNYIPDEKFQYYVFSPQLGWEPKPGYQGKIEGNVERKFDSKGFVSADTSQVSDSASRK